MPHENSCACFSQAACASSTLANFWRSSDVSGCFCTNASNFPTMDSIRLQNRTLDTLGNIRDSVSRGFPRHTASSPSPYFQYPQHPRTPTTSFPLIIISIAQLRNNAISRSRQYRRTTVATRQSDVEKAEGPS